MRKNSPEQSLESGARGRMRARYDLLWSETVERLQADAVALDPVLAARVPDARRGLTLIARPSLSVRKSVGAFLRELRRLEPGQHYYRGAELHLTVLPLFTATANASPFLARASRYIAAVDAALRRAGPFEIEFEGVTGSAGAVMIQGFLEDDALNDLRDALRTQLRAAGLAEGVDERYRLESAHMTVARFREPLRQSERLAAFLEQARQRVFGAAEIRGLSLVMNDWYLSSRVTETLKHYRLPCLA